MRTRKGLDKMRSLLSDNPAADEIMSLAFLIDGPGATLAQEMGRKAIAEQKT